MTVYHACLFPTKRRTFEAFFRRSKKKKKKKKREDLVNGLHFVLYITTKKRKRERHVDDHYTR